MAGGSITLLSPLSCSSSGSAVQPRAWLPAAFQLPLSGLFVSVSHLQPSPSAPTPLSICQQKKKRAQFCFLVASLLSLSNTCLILPLLPLLCAQRHTNEEKGPVTTARTNSTPKHSTWVRLRDLLQALSVCAAALGPAARDWHPEVCQQVHLGPAHHAAPGLIPRCQSDTVPQLPSLCHIHHRHSDDFAGSSSSIYMASTQLSHHHFF